MTFFEQLSNFGLKHITLDVIADNDKLTVAVNIKNTSKDSALDNLPPFFITKTPKALDETFFKELESPLVAVGDAITNASEFHAILEEKQKKTEKAKAITKTIESNTAKIKSLMKTEPLSDADRAKISSYVKAIKDVDTDNAFANETLAKLSETTLF